MPDRFSALIAALSLTAYWFWVIVKLLRLARKTRKQQRNAASPGRPKSAANAGNAMPRERIGQLMRILWYPCIFVLLAALWTATFRQPHLLIPRAMPEATPGRFGILDWLWLPGSLAWLTMPAAALLLLCTVLTFICWRKMGRSWRIGIDPGEKLELVSTGPYRFVRHPIYALRMVINLCAIMLAPTVLVLLTAAIDCLLLQIEARREERYMESQHGDQYARYKNSVGRFVPRAFVV